MPTNQTQRSKQKTSKSKHKPISFAKRPEFLALGLAIAAGLTSGILNETSQEAFREEIRQQNLSKAAYVVNKNVHKGSFINEQDLSLRRFRANNITRNYVTANTIHLVVGHQSLVDLKPGDPILLSAVMGARDAKGIASKIPGGKRLFTLTISSSSSGYGFVNPGDHVDIIGHLELPARGMTTVTLLQDVTLVSVGSRSIVQRQQKKGKTDVSFFVSPAEFELLAFAQKQGQFSLSLRNPKDETHMKADEDNAGIDVNKFLDHKLIRRASGGGKLKILEGHESQEDKS